MAAPRAAVAWAALLEAERMAPRATPVEQALIGALARRYDGPKPLDAASEAPALAAYADAIRQVAQKFPEDADVQTLFAESAMNINAWKLWTVDGKPVAGTEEIVATLEKVIAANPSHPGANHYYVHAVEASAQPEKGVASAERLVGMMPAAGHLEHMPAHILQRVGRYDEAAEANHRKGATADLAYFAQAAPPDYYMMYTAHNYQFLAFSAAMERRRQETLETVRKLRMLVPDQMIAADPAAAWNMVAYYQAMVRFGLWDEILAEQAPNPKLPGLPVGYHYARASALAESNRLADAKAELAELDGMIAAAGKDDAAGLNNAVDLYRLAAMTVRARIAAAEGKPDEAIARWREAVEQEDRLDYDEPADWFFPTRHLLGAALLKAGKAGEAEAVYRADLARNPANGWALFGLARALEAEGRAPERATAQSAFAAAWKHADMMPTTSAF